MSAESRPRPRKLVIVIGSLNLGGTERHVADIAPALRRRGFDVTVYCISELGAQAPRLRAAGINVIGPPLPPAAGRSRPMRQLRLALSAARLFALLVSRRPALVHCFLPVGNILGTLLARAALVPRVLTSRRSLNRYQAKHPWLGRIERGLHRRADAIVANSSAAARELVEEEGAPAARVHVIHNGIALGNFAAPVDRAQAREQLGLDPASLVFVIVANLIPYKGHLDLLAALAAVAPALPAAWTLLVVGGDYGEGGAVAPAVQRAGIGAHVRLLGVRTDIPVLLGAADIGVLASHEEGFPTAVIEYMAAGLPVVATAAGGTGEAVVDGETGLLVPVGDTAALGRALQALASDAQARRRMGAAGQARAVAEFSLDACVGAYERLYERMLAAD